MARNRKDGFLPANVDAERFILGSLLLDCDRFTDVAATLQVDHFALEKHRRIFQRMLEINERGERIDRVTVANELLRRDELASIDGLSYLVSLDDGLPHISNLDSYVKIVRDKAALRRIAISAQHLMNRAMLAEDSPEDILAGAEETLLGIGETRHSDAGLVHGGDFLRNFPGGFNAFAQPSQREQGLRTGFTKFDEMTGGLRPGELTILGARPSVGKSSMAMGIAWNVARQGTPVAVFSIEMSIESLMLRTLCSAARVDSHKMRAGFLNQQDRAKITGARDVLMEAPIYIDDSSNIGLLELHSKLRRLKKKLKDAPIGLVVVDYLQLMARPGKNDNANQDLSRLSRGLKLMAKEVGAHFLVLSQLSRATETRAGDKRPIISDLRDSGSIEADADIIGLLFRPEMHKRDREDLRGLAELIVGKSRGGPTGTVNMVFIHSQVRFENMAEDVPLDEEPRLPYGDD